MLDKLLHVPVRIAAVPSGDTIDLRLQIRTEKYFHTPTVVVLKFCVNSQAGPGDVGQTRLPGAAA
jgi:hypothetical protein